VTPDLYGKHCATDDVCHRGSCVTCIRSRYITAHGRHLLPATPTRHRLVQVAK
jgi:hypothetical protein